MGKIEIKKMSTISVNRKSIFITTIPKIIADTSGMSKGQKLLWKYDGDKIVIEILKEKQQTS